MTLFKGRELDLSWEKWLRNCRVMMKVSEWEMKGIRAEQVGSGLPGKGCENFPTFCFGFFFALGCLETILEQQVPYYLGYSCEGHWKFEIV